MCLGVLEPLLYLALKIRQFPAEGIPLFLIHHLVEVPEKLVSRILRLFYFVFERKQLCLLRYTAFESADLVAQFLVLLLLTLVFGLLDDFLLPLLNCLLSFRLVS